jgi:anti-sigma factor RsiW
MTPHEAIRQSLALSAAGLLDPAGERRVREHVRECPECAAELDAFAALSAGLSALPAPPPSPDLLAHTQAMITAELAAQADRRRGAILATAGGLFGWILLLAGWQTYRILTGNSGLLVWLVFSTIPSLLGAGAAAALLAGPAMTVTGRRLERNHL